MNRFKRLHHYQMTSNVFKGGAAFVLVLAAALVVSGVFPLQTIANKTSLKELEKGRASISRNGKKGSRRAQHSDVQDPRELITESAKLQEEAAAANVDLPKHEKRNKKGGVVGIMALITHTVINTNDGGLGSLRQAIVDSNTDGMPSQINFNIPMGDPGFNGSTFTIKPLTLFPFLSAPDAVIDGSTQTAFTGDTNLLGPEIVINGSMAPLNTRAFVVLSANNTIKGLCINGFAGPGGTAIQILGLTADNNTVTGCYIGTDATGASAVANGGLGIQVLGGSDSNHIGGTAAADRNIISGNRGGILISGNFIPVSSTAGSNVIQGNYIGVDRTGTIAIANTGDGIAIAGTTDNIIGGTAAGAGNVSSGNTANGVRLVGSVFDTTPTGDPDDMTGPYVVHLATGNVIQGNKFGTNAAGTAAIQNGVDGVRLNNAAQQNTVGGTTPEARNICSGNFAHGVHFDSVRPNFFPYTPVSHNNVQGNYIGTDAAGTGAIGNQLPGVIFFFGAIDNTVGGTNPGEGNVIAFNTGSQIPDGLGGFINVPGAGVSVSYDPTFTDPVLANDPTVNNRISGNSIHSNVASFSNDGLGIDLNGAGNETDPTDGVTTNDAGDPDDGGNRLQNFPVLTTVFSSGGSTTIVGTLNSTPNTTFSVEFFSNTACDPSGYGEGETFIGSAPVATGPTGDASFLVTFPTNVGCRSVTATATDPTGNTSEFSVCRNQAPTISCSINTTDLWPPNHNLINVGLSATAGDNCPNPTISVAVYSDEDDEAPTGEGNFSPDAKNIAVGTLRLRAERDGNLDGRVYLIIVTVTDSSGNTAHCCKTVTVPKSQSGASKQSVAAQAAAAIAYCEAHGTAPPGFVVVGDGPIVGPKQ